eukprot:TRINITY_DN6520_c0_g1_i2.p1 TRINITY_DN6520_c0_g1~~TRINITY_DN6520_c0_g1_i2.p1  ORF type:complete len:1016 (+),score=254.94 TRINITY_DN6520_c0_g1_i2:417-3464(+)
MGSMQKQVEWKERMKWERTLDEKVEAQKEIFANELVVVSNDFRQEIKELREENIHLEESAREAERKYKESWGQLEEAQHTITKLRHDLQQQRHRFEEIILRKLKDSDTSNESDAQNVMLDSVVKKNEEIRLLEQSIAGKDREIQKLIFDKSKMETQMASLHQKQPQSPNIRGRVHQESQLTDKIKSNLERSRMAYEELYTRHVSACQKSADFELALQEAIRERDDLHGKKSELESRLIALEAELATFNSEKLDAESSSLLARRRSRNPSISSPSTRPLLAPTPRGEMQRRPSATGLTPTKGDFSQKLDEALENSKTQASPARRQSEETRKRSGSISQAVALKMLVHKRTSMSGTEPGPGGRRASLSQSNAKDIQQALRLSQEKSAGKPLTIIEQDEVTILEKQQTPVVLNLPVSQGQTTTETAKNVETESKTLKRILSIETTQSMAAPIGGSENDSKVSNENFDTAVEVVPESRNRKLLGAFDIEFEAEKDATKVDHVEQSALQHGFSSTENAKLDDNEQASTYQLDHQDGKVDKEARPTPDTLVIPTVNEDVIVQKLQSSVDWLSERSYLYQRVESLEAELTLAKEKLEYMLKAFPAKKRVVSASKKRETVPAEIGKFQEALQKDIDLQEEETLAKWKLLYTGMAAAARARDVVVALQSNKVSDEIRSLSVFERVQIRGKMVTDRLREKMRFIQEVRQTNLERALGSVYLLVQPPAVSQDPQMTRKSVNINIINFKIGQREAKPVQSRPKTYRDGPYIHPPPTPDEMKYYHEFLEARKGLSMPLLGPNLTKMQDFIDTTQIVESTSDPHAPPPSCRSTPEPSKSDRSRTPSRPHTPRPPSSRPSTARGPSPSPSMTAPRRLVAGVQTQEQFDAYMKKRNAFVSPSTSAIKLGGGFNTEGYSGSKSTEKRPSSAPIRNYHQNRGSTTHDYTVQGQSIARADGHRTRYIAIDSRPTSARTAHVYSPDSPLPIYVDEDDGHQVHAPNNTISQSESVDILTHEHGNGTQISPDMAHHP